MVADSRPRNDQSVRAAAADTAENPAAPLGLKGTKWSFLSQKIPKIAIPDRGTSLRRVVATCIHPAARTPLQFTQVRIQMAATATAQASPVLSMAGTKTRR